ncbi:MAG: YfcC family protein [Bacilli bacterium]
MAEVETRKPTAEAEPKKKHKFHLGTFAILLCVILVVAIISWCANGQVYHVTADDGTISEAVVNGATLANIFMSPIKGFQDAIGVIGFVFILGAFLALTNATGALETGIKSLVRKMHGHEVILIPILMFIFSVCGTTYGMCEETVGFYILLAATMYAAGMDPIVGCATVLLGAGVGVLGSTVNPFATGVAISAAGVNVNQAIIIVEGIVLWLVTYAIATLFVVMYAKKVIKDKGSTILSLQELHECDLAYGNATKGIEEAHLTKKQVAVLIVFGITFLVMILSFIPWQDIAFGGDEAKFLAAFGWSQYLTGTPLGWWYFDEAAMWFMLMGAIIGFIGMPDRSQFSKVIISGFGDMIGVNLVIALARASTVLLATTGAGKWLVEVSVNGLAASGMPSWCFIGLDYLLHIGLSFLVPSSSGLAGLSSPIVSPIMQGMIDKGVSGYKGSVETSIMALVAANGVVNLITPTSGAIMGGLAIAHVNYSTWVKWSWKPILCIAGASLVILIVSMLIVGA